MRIIGSRFVVILLAVLVAGTTACVSTKKLPLLEGKEVVAMVNGEPITREEYEQEISSLHAKMAEKKDAAHEMTAADKEAEKKQPPIDYTGLMKRMIDARLVVQEAKRIGLNELPEVREQVANASQKALRTQLMNQVLKDVKPDESVAGELYDKAIHEWKFRAVMFPKEDDAKKMEKGIKAGGDFAVLADHALADKKARRAVDEGYLDGNQILSPIYDALLTMGTGSVSPIIPVAGGFALVKLEDARVEESEKKKELATVEALRRKKEEVTKAFTASLKTKLAKTDTALLDAFDFESSLAVFDELTKDERVLTEIAGNGRITVADLAGELQRRYFHGVERQIGKKDLNTKKYPVLDEMVEKKVLEQEARNEGLDKTDAFTVQIKSYEDSQLFGMFVQKVVLPEIKIEESEIKAYYDGHLSDYTSSERLQLDSVVFTKRSDAEEAMRKLRSGDQLSWIRANAEGQVGKDAEGLLELRGTVVMASTLAAGLKSALSGAGAGDFRLYESPEGYFYVISVVAVYPPSVQDYSAVRPTIARQLYTERVQTGVAGWIEKLRSAGTVDVYLKY